jgi:lipopolysaccharide/colanic/teichoic acid biosynthesis glycosyltransferase
MVSATHGLAILATPDIASDPLCGCGLPEARCRTLRRPRTAIARVRSRCSLVARRLADGEAIVRPAGNTAANYQRAKRLLDIVGSLALLVAFAPVMAAVFVVLLITTRGRPLFIQRRAGWLGRPFSLVKFRTMCRDAERLKGGVANEMEGPMFKNRRDPRITRLGRWLRKTSLDETPQLFHVLLGQMSLVGPRPLDVNEVARFSNWQRQRLTVKPGLTCLWQISGRNEIDFVDGVRMDMWYVRHQSFWTDWSLLWRTPRALLVGRGAY